MKKAEIHTRFSKIMLDFCHDRYYNYVMTKEGGDLLSPRTGRPTDNPKGNRKSYRLSNDDIKKLNLCVQKSGMTETDVIRKGIDLVYQEVNKK